jgi:hypothetical protein
MPDALRSVDISAAEACVDAAAIARQCRLQISNQDLPRYHLWRVTPYIADT